MSGLLETLNSSLPDTTSNVATSSGEICILGLLGDCTTPGGTATFSKTFAPTVTSAFSSTMQTTLPPVAPSSALSSTFHTYIIPPATSSPTVPATLPPVTSSSKLSSAVRTTYIASSASSATATSVPGMRTSPDDTHSASRSSSSWIAIAAAVISFVTLAASVALCLWLRRKKSRKFRKSPRIMPFAPEASPDDVISNALHERRWSEKRAVTQTQGLDSGPSLPPLPIHDDLSIVPAAETTIATNPGHRTSSPSPTLRNTATSDLPRQNTPDVSHRRHAAVSLTETCRSIETQLPQYTSSPSPAAIESSMGFLNRDPYAWQPQANGIEGDSANSSHGRSSSGQTLPPAYQPRQDVSCESEWM